MAQPRFPGYAACLAMMRHRDPDTQEQGFHWLLKHAAEHVGPLMEEFRTERDHGLRCWLLELIGEAKSENPFPLMIEQLRSSDESLRGWAAHGLRTLNTPEARKALYEAGVK